MGKVNVQGVVGVPKEYFLRMAKHDYEEFKSALPREFYQNSVDAGATEISVDFDEEKRIISVADNGCGMDLDTLKNKLLVLGGSKKRSKSVGAFGKAKEILFFSWEKYSIHTGQLMVRGTGAEYTIKNSRSKRQGTKCSITIPGSEDFKSIASYFRMVAGYFETDAAIYVGGKRVECSMKRGNLVRDTSWCKLYHKEEVNDWRLQVRIDGQWMFAKWLGTSDIGQLVLELKKESTDILTSNRDGIKSNFSEEFSKLIKEFMVERENALRPPKKITTERIVGTGAVKVNWEKMQQKIKESQMYYNWNVQEAKEQLSKAVKNINDAIVSQRITLAVEEQKESYSWDYENRLAFIGYEPDFILKYEDGDRSRVDRFMSTRKALVIAHAWTEIVKQVLLDIGYFGAITCGFDFQSEERAFFIEGKDGCHMFLINPEQLLADMENPPKNPLSNRTLLKEDLILCAIHEVAHIWESYHDSSFVKRIESIRANTWKSERLYKAIITSAFKK